MNRNVEEKELHGMMDLLSEDTSFFDTSSDGFLLHHSSGFQEEQKSSDLLEKVETISLGDVPDNPRQSEPERIRKKGKCNLRKSLAWDNAFFTNAGFLEPEELSSMIEGVDKGGKSVLPVIQEDDIRMSIESISTMESDSLAMESLEADLFQDIRASIQKSSKASAADSSNQARSAKREVQTIQSSVKMGLASQNKVKAKPTSKRPTISTQGSGKMTEESLSRQQVPQPAVRGRESAPFLPKLPKALGRANSIPTVPTKRASLGANRLKLENSNAKSSTVAVSAAPSSRMLGMGGARRVVPLPTKSLKSSSSGSLTATKTEIRTSSSSLDSSGSTSSDNVGKSHLSSIRRKIDSKAVKPPSAGSKIVSKNRIQPGNSRLSTHLKTATKLSASISPASSISEWSCGSSSPTSTNKQRSSNSKSSLNSSSPCKRVSVGSDAPSVKNLQNQSNGHYSLGHETQATGLPSQCFNEVTIGTGASACPVSAKPSGLRLPSPKIGFFDGVKSAVRTPKGGTQSHSGVISALPKPGSSSSGSTGGPTNTKLRNVQPTSTVTAIKSIKPIQHISPIVKPTSLTPSREPSNASTKISSAIRAVRNSPGLSPKVQNLKSPKTGGNFQLKTKEEGALRGKCDTDPCLESKMSAEIRDGVQLKNTEITPVDGNGCNATSNSSSNCTTGIMSSSQKDGEIAPYVQKLLKNGVCSFSNTDESYENCDDGMRGDMEAMNPNKEMQKELMEISVSKSDVNCAGINYPPECSSSLEVHACGQTQESLNIPSNPTPQSLSRVTSEITAGTRIPFAVKNSFSDVDEIIESFKGLTVEVVEKTATPPLLESAQKENS